MARDATLRKLLLINKAFVLQIYAANEEGLMNRILI